MPIVQTVTGPVDAAELGICYAHEHLLAAPPPPSDADFVLDDADAAAAEMTGFRNAGGSAIVEMSTADYGRDAAGLRGLSVRTGVHVVCASGFNKDDFSAPYVEAASEGELVDRFVREIREGIDGSGVRAGLVKASSTLDRISPLAEKVFRAAASAHRQTGVPVATHTEAGTMALEQVRLLAEEGVDPARVVIGHMDRRLQAGYHLEVASTGAYLSFDQISKTKYDPDVRRAEMIVRLVDEGFGRQVLLGCDLARRSYLPAYSRSDTPSDGPGLRYLLDRFVPLLREVGLDAAAVDDLLIRNPSRAFSFLDVPHRC